MDGFTLPNLETLTCNSVLFVAERDPKDLGLQWSFINIVRTAYLVPPIDSFPEANKFEYKNATIIHTLDVAKNEYNIGERVELKPKLINIGNQTVRIIHGHPLFIINAYDSSGKAVWVDSGIILTIGISAELKPGVPYGGSEYNLQKGYDIMFCKPGEYKIVSYADFSIEEKAASFHNLKIYSEPVTIKVGTPAQQSVIWSKLYDGSDIGERIGSVISHDLRGNIYTGANAIEVYLKINDETGVTVLVDLETHVIEKILTYPLVKLGVPEEKIQLGNIQIKNLSDQIQLERLPYEMPEAQEIGLIQQRNTDNLNIFALIMAVGVIAGAGTFIFTNKQ